MATETEENALPKAKDNPKLAILLAAAMFVLVVDISMMNVSISAIVKDLGTLNRRTFKF